MDTKTKAIIVLGLIAAVSLTFAATRETKAVEIPSVFVVASAAAYDGNNHPVMWRVDVGKGEVTACALIDLKGTGNTPEFTCKSNKSP